MNSDTVIIIIIFASIGLLIFFFVLLRLFRSLSATSNPLPPVQPLAHHRQSFYQLQHQQNNSKSSLLDDDFILVDPQPNFRHDQQRSSLLPSVDEIHKPRPTSVASSSSLGRRGLPHSPHSQMHIVLPAPLGGSPSNFSLVATSEFGHVPSRRPPSSSRPSSSRPSSRHSRHSRHFLDVTSASDYDRRSISLVDRWLPPPDSYSLNHEPMPRVPSPLIPLSSSSSSLSQSQKPRSVAPSPSPQRPAPDIGTATRPTTSHSAISITRDTSTDPDLGPIAIPIPMPIPVPTIDIPPTSADNIPIPSVPADNPNQVVVTVEMDPSTSPEV